jgi:hypothetical protein
VVQAIEEALQGEGLVLTRETDLEIVQEFLKTQRPGLLHVVIEDPEEGDHDADIECDYGVTKMGEYIIKWHADSIEDVMCNGKTYLQPLMPGMKLVPEGAPVYFSNVREAFFGDWKAFVVCQPSPEEKANG